MNPESLSVLAIDDHRDFLLALKSELEDRIRVGVRTASTGREAHDLLLAAAPDALVVDLHLDGEDGVEVARSLKEVQPDLEIVLLTGHTDIDRTRVYRAGLSRVLIKDQDSGDLRAEVVLEAAQQGFFNRLTRALLRADDFDSLRETLVAVALALTSAHEASIVLPLPDGGFDIFPPLLSENRPRFEHHYVGRHLTREILMSGVSYAEPDAQGNVGVDEALKRCDIGAFAGLPILGADGISIAVLYVYWHRDTPVEMAAAMAMLKKLASHAAVGLAMARGEREASLLARQRQKERLETLRESVLREVSLEAALERIAQEVNSIVSSRNGERASVYYRVEGGQSPRYLARGSTMDPKRFPVILPKPRDEGYTFHMLQEGKPLLIDDLAHAEPAHEEVHRLGVNSLLGVPILHRAEGGMEAIGAIYALSTQPAAFQPADAEMLTEFAASTAPHLVRMHALRESQEIADAARRIRSSLYELRVHIEPEGIAHRIASFTKDLVRADFAVLLEAEAGTQEMRLAAASFGPLPEPHPLVGLKGGILGQAAESLSGLVITRCAGAEAPGNPDPETPVSMLLLPLHRDGQAEGLLLAARHLVAGADSFSAADHMSLRNFAVEAGERWAESKQIGPEARRRSRAESMRGILDFMNEQETPETLYHVVLTGLTADFGLQLNRAALFILNPQENTLIGELAIGDLDRQSCRESWRQARASGADTLQSYIQQMRTGTTGHSPLEERVRGLRIQRGDEDSAIFWSVVDQQRYELIDALQSARLDELPLAFRERFLPSVPLALLALRLRGRSIGLVVVDNLGNGNEITKQVRHDLERFLDSAAIALERMQAREEERKAAEEMARLYSAGSLLLSRSSPKPFIDRVAEIAQNSTEADGVTVLDMTGDTVELGSAGVIKWRSVPEVMRTREQGSLSIYVKDTGQPAVIEDAANPQSGANPSWLELGIGAGICVPMAIEDRRVGVVWFHYRTPRRFPPALILRYRAFADQAAHAWQMARRASRRTDLDRLLTNLAACSTMKELIQVAADRAAEWFSAHWCALWPYSGETGLWLTEMAAVSGAVDKAEWLAHRDRHLRPGTTTTSIFQTGFRAVEDMSIRYQSAPMNEDAYAFLLRNGVRSWLGVGLTAWDVARGKRVQQGVLFLNYKNTRTFSPDEIEDALLFARQVGQIMATRMLLDRLNATVTMTAEAAKFLVHGETLQEKLDGIVRSTQVVTQGNIVTLYAQYANGELSAPAARGIDPALLTPGGMPKADSIVPGLIAAREPRLEVDAQNCAPFCESRFVRTNGIASVAAAPLVVAGKGPVGILFVNYKERHLFTDADRLDIQHFADIAAASIDKQLQIDEVKRMGKAMDEVRGVVGDSDAVTWMKAIRKGYSHKIVRECGVIGLDLENIRRTLSQAELERIEPHLERLNEARQKLDAMGKVHMQEAGFSVFEHVPVASFVRNIVDKWSAAEERKERTPRSRKALPIGRIRLQFATEISDATTVFAIPEVLEEILYGLLTNARDALAGAEAEQPQIHVRLAADGRQVALTVADNGCGFSAEELQLAFKSLFNDPGRPWRGLGLLEIQDRVNLCKGSVSARNGPLSGAELTVRLAASEAQSAGHTA